MLKESLELHRQGRHEEAEKGYRSVLAENPLDGEALRLLGMLRRERGDREEAVRLLDRAHQLAPEQPGLLLMLGAIHAETGDYAKARDAYSRVLTLDPNISGAHTSLGQLSMIAGDRKLAEQHFRTALRANEDPHAVSGLGLLALDAGDVDTAMKHLTRAADLAPNDASIAFSLGRGFHQRGMQAFAEQAFLTALRLRPGMPQATHALGQMWINGGRAAEAEPLMRTLAQTRGFELPGRLGVADALRAQDKLEEAIAAYEHALELRPDHEAGLEAMLWSLNRLGRQDQAIERIDAIIAAHPQPARWRAERAAILASIGRYAEAAADWQFLHDATPDSVHAMVQLARLRERLGEHDVALALADKAAAIAPDDIDAAFVRTRAHLRDGDDATAESILAAFENKPISPDQARLSLNYLARIHDRTGRKGEAARFFTEAQRGMQGTLPILDTLPADYDVALAASQGEVWEHAPILLIGVPGSGVERIAALLADQAGLCVMRDRINSARDDGFDTRAFDHTRSDLDTAGVAVLREEYLAGLRARGIGTERPIVDWIVRWDARFLPYARRVLNGTRIVVVDRDPRDALINWLAFGAVPYMPLADFEPCVDWLARARQHTLFGVEHGGVPHLVVNAEQVLADPTGAGAELARFVGVDRLQPGPALASTEYALGGLPSRFPDGYWESYAEVLAAPFARVLDKPLAET